MPSSRTLALAAALAVLPFGALAAEPPTPTISLSAEGIVRAAPDTAIVTAGVVTEKPTAGDALSENNAAMARMLEELRAAGIADADVATTGFSIDPVMVYPQPRQDGTQDPPRITGYRVSNDVTVRIRAIGTAGDVLDRVVRIGANQIRGISFTVAEPDALLDEARAKAIRAAAEKARVYAEAGGFTVGRILEVREGGGYAPPMPMMRMAAADMAAESVPIAVGEREMSVSVTVTWEIAQPN